MNMHTTDVMNPVAPKRLEDFQLPQVMMRDILLKTVFRKSLDMVSDLSRALCIPIPVVQELIDLCRDQRLMQATGTLNANNGNEMGYQLTDAGKARALDALAQSEYFGPFPVPLKVFAEQVKRQSIRNIHVTRNQLVSAMGHLVLPDSLLDHLGPAVSAGRSVLMYGPPGNGKSSISNRDPQRPLAISSLSPTPSNMPDRSSPSMTRSCIHPCPMPNRTPRACGA